ncbi:hypothetical protein [Cylindrospermum stagnale]|uniref:hypothetical protein n=1 Tax=Cylindrospermum stagnale TaxID=142864 RepID=UPI00030F2C36|nr:hypothetical protein [Cylindrospermum stagnale]
MSSSLALGVLPDTAVYQKTAMLAAYFVRDAFYCFQTFDFSNFGVKFLSRFYWMKKT